MLYCTYLFCILFSNYLVTYLNFVFNLNNVCVRLHLFTRQLSPEILKKDSSERISNGCRRRKWHTLKLVLQNGARQENVCNKIYNGDHGSARKD